jgi:hypothetical protein
MYTSGALLNLSSFEAGQQMQLDVASPLRGLLEVHVVRNSNTTLMMGLVAKGCTDHNTCLFAKTIFNHTEVPGQSRSSLP